MLIDTKLGNKNETLPVLQKNNEAFVQCNTHRLRIVWVLK